MAETPHSTEQGRHAHEERDVRLKPIAFFGLGLVGLAILVHIGLALLYMFFTERWQDAQVPASPLAAMRQPLSAPPLQARPTQELQEMLAGENAVLRSYGWVDREGGVARIPIRRAIDLLLQRGLPVRNGSAEPQHQDGGAQP